MPWADLCARGGLTTGTEVQLAQLCGPTPDPALITRAGLPAAATLAKFVDKAQGLKLDDTYSGIAFHIVIGSMNRSDVTTTRLFKGVENTRKSAAVCFEDAVFFSRAAGSHPAGTHILVHQSLAPCERCRGGYKVWAQNNLGTIVLSADKAYDGSSGNPIFIFSPSGTVYYIK